MPYGVYVRTEEYRRNRSGIGNPMWNRHHSDEARKKISNANKGHKPYVMTKETIKKIGDAHRGKSLSECHRKKISDANRGKNCFWYGKHHSKRTKRKLSIFFKGKSTWNKGLTKENDKSLEKVSKAMSGKKHYFFGKHFSEKTRKKMSESRRGGKSHFWKGGISFEPYGLEFNKILKEHIRKRDNCICQECDSHQDKIFTKTGMHKKLYVHHIDYNKKNNKSKNLISLCLYCHSKTNFSRKDWTKHFKEKMC